MIRRFGAVLDTRDGGGVRLWVPGLTEEDGDWMPAPPSLVEIERAVKGATFEVEGDDLATAHYSRQAYDDLDLDELVEHAPPPVPAPSPATSKEPA